MKIRRNIFKIAAGGRNEDGSKAEPEEQATALITQLPTDTTHGGQATKKQMNTEVVVYGSAGEAAEVAARPCHGCKHWDRTAWAMMVRDADRGTEEERQAINTIRGEILVRGLAEIGDDGDSDVEKALFDWGKCHAGSAHDHTLVVTHAVSTCPKEYHTPGAPFGFYQARNREVANEGQKARDAILQTAQGKIVT